MNVSWRDHVLKSTYFLFETNKRNATLFSIPTDCCCCFYTNPLHLPPKVTTYVAAAVAPLVLGGYLPLGSLVASPCEGLLEGGKAAEFAVAVLSEVNI